MSFNTISVFLLSTVALTIALTCPAQSLQKADSFLDEGHYKEAIVQYKNYCATDTSDYNCVYGLATAFAYIHQPDSVFIYLDKLIALNTAEFPLQDPAFFLLRSDKRWAAYEDKLVAAIQEKYGQPFADEAYARKLWAMNASDQAYYKEIESAEKTEGKGGPLANQLWKLKEEINMRNQKELEYLIRKYGWPKSSQVGVGAANAAFLVIQHSTLQKQQKYLPVIRKRCEEHEADWQCYALMYDRIQVGLGKPQRFGTQIAYNPVKAAYELSPLEDEDMVDQWRREMSMGPLSEYVAHWNIQWSPKSKR